MLKTFVKLKVGKREKRKLMRLQRTNVVLEPDSDNSFDSEDDFKDFNDAYSLFKEEFDVVLDDDNFDSSDPQQMRLFRGVLERDALDPQRKAYRK